MMSMSCHWSNAWAARVVASLGLLMAAPGSADEVPEATQGAPETITSVASTATPASQPVAAHQVSGPTASTKSARRGDRSSPSNTAGTSLSSATSVPASSASPSTTGEVAPKVVCFQSSIRCFSAKPPATNPSVPAAALDLRAPDIKRVFPQAELQQVLPDPMEEEQEMQAVQVEGERPVAPVSVGLMAIPWAIIHPTQAWRILMPVPQAK